MQPRSGVSISTSAALHFLYKPFVALSRSRLVWQPIHCTVKCKSVEKPKQSDFRGKLSPPFLAKRQKAADGTHFASTFHRGEVHSSRVVNWLFYDWWLRTRLGQDRWQLNIS